MLAGEWSMDILLIGFECSYDSWYWPLIGQECSCYLNTVWYLLSYSKYYWLSMIKLVTLLQRYGGTHRLRFDSKGQGLGVAGRRDIRKIAVVVHQASSSKEIYIQTINLTKPYFYAFCFCFLKPTTKVDQEICPCYGPSPQMMAWWQQWHLCSALGGRTEYFI